MAVGLSHRGNTSSVSTGSLHTSSSAATRPFAGLTAIFETILEI